MSEELKDLRIPIMMTASEVQTIDDWMFDRRLKSRSEATRRLVQRGIMFDLTAEVTLILMNDLSDIIDGKKLIPKDIKRIKKDIEFYRNLLNEWLHDSSKKVVKPILEEIRDSIKAAVGKDS